ncbi:unnamed protein product [Pieris macdunnoughi]|uniref:Uncharacterized protein n=1 Tax=Pieris macdunnoughi TaxID=345717 RepID=A0A821WQ11_9NEOP|nr:unnamed protein product [Pieris macdunnoughi]
MIKTAHGHPYKRVRCRPLRSSLMLMPILKDGKSFEVVSPKEDLDLGCRIHTSPLRKKKCLKKRTVED